MWKFKFSSKKKMKIWNVENFTIGVYYESCASLLRADNKIHTCQRTFNKNSRGAIKLTYWLCLWKLLKSYNIPHSKVCDASYILQKQFFFLIKFSTLHSWNGNMMVAITTLWSKNVRCDLRHKLSKKFCLLLWKWFPFFKLVIQIISSIIKAITKFGMHIWRYIQITSCWH
jgi:hypothetical protein